MAYSSSLMNLAIKQADYAHYISRPNPNVGAIVVKNNKVIGFGYSQAYGSDHAEIVALKEAGNLAKDGELYVTLEPCSHQGKTPPCTDAIIKAGIKTVYIGILDPNPLVAGRGVELLKKAGIKVQIGYKTKQIEKQLEYYLHWRKHNLPFVMMKNAVSLDGKIAAPDGNSKWITSEEARHFGRLKRAEGGAIITGIGTVLADNPMLILRADEMDKLRIKADNNHIAQPVRIILDSSLKIPLNSKIVETAKEYKTIIIKSNSSKINHEKEDKLRQMGVNIIGINSIDNKIDLKALLVFLAEHKFTSIFIEAGPKLSTAFLNQGLVDKVFYFIAPKALGGTNDVYQHLHVDSLRTAIEFERVIPQLINKDNILLEAYVKKDI